MKAIHMLAVGLILLATGAQATDFTLKSGVSGLFDWTDGNNYVGGEAPGAGDAVIVPQGVTVTISDGLSDASVALVDSLARIRPEKDARVVFVVEAGRTNSFDCAVNYDGETDTSCRGTLVKEGPGGLLLTAALDRFTYGTKKDRYQSYACNIEVNGGLLKFNQDSSAPSQYHTFGKVTVAEGATWCPPFGGKITIKSGLVGGGTVVNEGTGYQYVNMGGGTAAEPLEFSGAMLGCLSFSFLSKCYINLTGTNSTGGGTFDVTGNHVADGGRIGIRKFGKIGQPSSIGVQGSNINLASRNGYWLTSLRRPEDPIDETDKNFLLFTFANNTTGSAVIDGGAVGGVKLIGTIGEHPSEKCGQKRIVLTGSNTEECVQSSVFARKYKDAYPTGGYTFHLTKRGTGTWHFTKTDSAFTGALAVEEGTLKFDSIANKGTKSTLGTAEDLYAPIDCGCRTDGVLTADDQVGYAFLLGDGTDAHEGNLEYAGSNDVLPVTGRPLAVNGKGRLTNGTTKNFNFTDVYTVGTGDNVLTLDGDDTSAVNVLTGVNDSKDSSGAPLSIVKDGEGTWKLTGDLSVRGSILVKKGTLFVKNNYTWYKWLIKSGKYEAVGDTSAAISISIGEFGLYASDGSRQNKGLSYTRADNGTLPEYPNVKTGHIDYGFTATEKFTPQNVAATYPRDLSRLVDDVYSTGLSYWYQTAPDTAYYAAQTGNPKDYRNVPHNVPDQETTWLPIVMNLGEEALPVAYYDYVTRTAGNAEVYRTTLFGSVDGTNWEPLEDEDQCRLPQAMTWSFAGRAAVDGGDLVHTNGLGEVDGRAIASVPLAYRDGYLTDVSSYGVSSGATLKIRGNAAIGGLTVDPSGAGTIDGGTFAASGSIDVTGMAKDVKSMTVKFNLVSTSGFGNVANWTLKENGVPTAKLSASVNEDGTITINRAGLLLLVR